LSLRIIVYYPVTACLTIFCNILISPLNSSAEDDVKVLQLVPDLVRKLPSRKLSINEMSHIRPIEDFVVELARLAACARQQAGKIKSTSSSEFFNIL
jgi:hypothetical protein